MSLGVGGATTFAQASNHQTAHNHSVRDTSAYEHSKQTKVKCTQCGMWVGKGKACGFCKHPDGVSAAASPKAVKNAANAAAPKEKTTVSNNALTHVHRDTSGYSPAKQTKVKCGSCGVWAKKGGTCSLCKRPVGNK